MSASLNAAVATATTATACDPGCAEPLPVLGRDVTVPLVTGGEVTYAALDYAASAPALQRVWDDVAAYAPYYGSVHRAPATSRSSPPTSSSRAGPPSPSSSTAAPPTRWSSPGPPPTP